MDLSTNSISHLQEKCIVGPSVHNLVINVNPLKYIRQKSFFNLLNVSSLKLNDMKIEFIEHSFFSSDKNNMLKHLDISNNLLTSISSVIFGCLENLNILLVHGNNFIQLIFEIPDNIKLYSLFVDHVIQCKYINTRHL